MDVTAKTREGKKTAVTATIDGITYPMVKHYMTIRKTFK